MGGNDALIIDQFSPILGADESQDQKIKNPGKRVYVVLQIIRS